MRGYFYTLLVASVCGAVCAMLAWGGFEKYIKYIASLVCIVLLISPLREIDITKAVEKLNEAVESLPEGESPLYETAASLTEREAEKYLTEIVFNKFGIKPIYSDINIDWTLDEPTIQSITVALSVEDMPFADDVDAYLEQVLGGEVTVVEGQ